MGNTINMVSERYNNVLHKIQFKNLMNIPKSSEDVSNTHMKEARCNFSIQEHNFHSIIWIRQESILDELYLLD
ncbi:unnamed protein product [Schistosoma bovis]|nr:unnamed protein product [Schistosoma bovis]